MSIARQAFKGASWLALFKLFSQVFSWTITILIARILLPEEYGLYAMAFLITGYAEMFRSLGLGAAIIQRQSINNYELSSIFWFSIFVSVVFAILCFPIAYLSAYLFDEPRIIPLTESISLLFIFSGLQIVPTSLLRKEMEFKKLGILELISVFASGLSMLLIAYLGGGVWALIGGRIVLALVMVILLYTSVRWFPLLHYSFNEAKSYIKFGLKVATGGSLFYISENSDRFFAGRSLGATSLGYYSFALQLAQIPTEKIVVLINQVSFPVFSKLQDDKEKFNQFYLNIIEVTGILVLPIFVGGYLLGDDFVKVLLGEKWLPITTLFELLCLTQIITALNVYNNFVHDARGFPRLSLLYNFICALTMSVAFYFAAQYGLQAMLVPWFSVYLLISVMWIAFTLRQINISYVSYLNTLAKPVVATLFMAFAIYLFETTVDMILDKDIALTIILVVKILLGAAVYTAFFWFFDRKTYYTLREFFRKS